MGSRRCYAWKEALPLRATKALQFFADDQREQEEKEKLVLSACALRLGERP